MTHDTDVQNGISRILPHTVHFLLNDKCNAKCVFCGGDYYRSKSGKVITLDKFARMADNLHLEHFRNICLAGAGDPLLDPDFMPIVRYTNERYPNVDITVTTNGIALKPELSAEMMGAKVSLVNISINAATRATYKRLMQVDQFDTVCANAAAFVRERDRACRQTLFQFSCAISRLNIEELPTLVELAHQLGVRHLNIFYCRFYPKSIRHLNIEATEYLLEDRESLFFHQELSDRTVMEAKALAERYGIFMGHEPLFREKGQPKKCVWTETELLVGFDGEVYPCGGGEVHFKKKVESGVYRFGNALTQRIDEFWNNDTYRKLRISCRRGAESPIAECRFCANLMQHDDIRSHLMEWEGFEEEKPAAKKRGPLPLVSVIVPTHNRPDMLPDTLRSILAQSYPNIEIVVVNDAGEDVERLVKEVAPTAVYLRHERNKGLAGARNTGIRHATGKYIAYLDDDDLFYPEHIETLVTFLEGSDCKVAYTDSYRAFQSQASGRYEVVRREIAHGIDFDYDRILVDNFVPVLCFMHEKGCIEESGYFDESLRRHEDWDLWIRMSRTFRFAHIPKVTCEFSCRVDGSGMSTGTVPMFLVTRNAIYAKYRHLATPDVQRRQRADTWEFMRHLYTFLEGRVEPLLPLFTAGRQAEGEARLAELVATGATEAQRESALADQLALASLKNGAVTDAVTQLERAVADDGMNPLASHNLAAVYRTTGRSADATRIYRQIVERNESEVPALMALAELAAERGDVTEARRRYEQVLAVEPNHCAAGGALTALPAAAPEAATGNRLKVAVYSLDHPEHACARIRVIAPAETLNDAVELRWGVDLGTEQAGVNTALIAWADLIVVQRFFPMANTAPLLERILAAGKPVIYETDDLLVEVPTTNPHQQGADAARPFIFDLIARAAAVTVSTEEMKRAFAPHHRQIHVLPNLLDNRLWSAPLPARTVGAPVVIGYAGTPDHRADLALMEEVLERIAAKYGNRVAFRFMGCDTERIKRLPGFSTITFEPGYANYARTIRKAGIDIGLVPLADNRFNRCKSNIKWLEYSACGIAGIYADLSPYRSCVRDGETGLLVSGYDADAWVAAIESLIDNPDRRHAMALAARTEVLATYTLKSRGHLFLDTWRRVAGRAETTAKEQEMPISPQPFAPITAPTEAATPRVSIIIPLYNKVEYTKQCLEALALNTDHSLGYEVILVDNASSDGTADYLRTLSGEVTVVTNRTNLGFAKACNQGGRIARGRYLVFLNNDTIPHPAWLDGLIRGTERDGADIVGAKLLYPNGRTQHAGVAFNEQSIGYHIFNGFPADAPAVNRKRFMQCVTAACMLVKRELFAELDGFDEGYVNGFEDVDFCLRAGERGRRILYTPESALIHFEETSEGRKSHDEPNIRRFLSRWEGKVRRDDADLYRAEGFGTERMADGRLRIFPAQTAEAPRPSAPPPSPLQPLAGPCVAPPAPATDRERALALKGEGRFIEALGMFSKILTQGDRSVLVEMGDCLAALDKTSDAVSLYEEALALDPISVRAHVGLGIVRLLTGALPEAATAFQQALREAPGDPKALCGLGLVRCGQERHGEGFELFSKALDADPENLTAIHELVKLAYTLNRFRETAGRLETYLMYHPGDTDILFSYAGLLHLANEPAKARDALERLLTLSPGYEGAPDLLAKLAAGNVVHNGTQRAEATPAPATTDPRRMKEEGNFEGALAAFSRMVESGDRTVRADIGDCLANMGRLDDAAVSYQDALREDDSDLKALVGLGVVSLMQGKQVKAVTWFNRALKADPANARALCGLGMVRNMQGKGVDAFDCFARALDADPENLAAIRELVQLAYATERFEEALPRLDGYLRYHPADLDMLYTLTGVRFKAGRHAEALESIEKVLLFAPDYEGGRELVERIREGMAA
ncbi:glycosyltransferase [Geobacter pickeringii]|uniref:glycosyltransferase n=1 Tax=Geobacter pickeringii TaxID=345632 RepID=UPI00068B21D1|nr:glycosyltransferase [Geobacter pickeringii]